MAPTIIVGDDESAGDVAAALLAAADSQRDVRVRTDLSRPAFEVPDALYKKHVGRRTRSEDEQRVNAVDELVAGDDAEHAIVSGDELPDAAKVVDPADVGDVAGDLVSDELPDAARVVAPPSNAEQPNTGDTGTAEDGDTGNRANSDDDARTEGSPADDPEPPKPRKRASRSRAAKSTPAAAGPAE